MKIAKCKMINTAKSRWQLADGKIMRTVIRLYGYGKEKERCFAKVYPERNEWAQHDSFLAFYIFSIVTLSCAKGLKKIAVSR